MSDNLVYLTFLALSAYTSFCKITNEFRAFSPLLFVLTQRLQILIALNTSFSLGISRSMLSSSSPSLSLEGGLSIRQHMVIT